MTLWLPVMRVSNSYARESDAHRHAAYTGSTADRAGPGWSTNRGMHAADSGMHAAGCYKRPARAARAPV